MHRHMLKITTATAAVFVGLLSTFTTAALAEPRHHAGGINNHNGFNQHYVDRDFSRSRHLQLRRYSDNDDDYGRRHHRHRGFGFGGISIDLGGNSGCGYSYRKWQATGSRYWRERYYDCVS